MRTEEQKRSDQEIEEVLEHGEAICAAMKAGKSGAEIEKMIIAMPLFPNVARSAVMVLGKKRFLEKGYDRTKADAEYGESWIDEVDAERRELTGMVD